MLPNIINLAYQIRQEEEDPGLAFPGLMLPSLNLAVEVYIRSSSTFIHDNSNTNSASMEGEEEQLMEENDDGAGPRRAQLAQENVFTTDGKMTTILPLNSLHPPFFPTFFDVKQYLSATDAECVKVTRVYQPDRNYSDRWIVEFDNEKDARSVIRHHGEVNNRTIRTERIPARKADEQYAVLEPDEKDGGGKRSSDESNNKRERDRGGRGERDRPRERDRGSNRSRSPKGRSGRGRSMDMVRSNPSERGSAASTAVWAKEERAKQPTVENSLDGKADRDRQTKEQQRQNKPQHQQQPPSMGSSNSTGSLNMISNAAVFGAFSFPDNHNNTAYRARPGGTAHIGVKANEPKPLRAFEFFPPLPTSGTHRPPIPLNHLEGGGVAGGQKASSPPANQHNPHIPPLIRTTASNGGFWPRAAAAASAGAFGTARQQLTASTSANPVQPILPANLSRPTTAAKTPAALFNASVCSLDTSIGSTAAGLVIQEDYSMDEADSDNDARVHPAPSKTDGLTDQPPLDLLEPESDTSAIPSQAQLGTKAERRAFDSAPNREFTPQELELRPHLAFLERYREDPNSSSCIRLENVPRMVYAEQLAEFLGVQFDFPCENIARMQNGVLYINLPNEAMATKAASQNMNILNGHQIIITQLKKTEMADSIRQNMIIIREMYRVSVVARGFPLITQRNEVISMFERFSLNRDGVEKCAVKPNDTVSTFFLTFSSAQDCREAIRALNDTQTVGGARIKVFQPADVASLNRTS
uniref:RRM domain-containing protein n=1 Tax=Globodera pallida TaxID=36090 RepID=A0A183C9H5_GLOPA